jgi:hypothetical protein
VKSQLFAWDPFVCRIQNRGYGSEIIRRRAKMKNQAIRKSANQWVRLPLSFSNTGEREAFLTAVRQLDEQTDRLGILDPPETEPAVLYSSREGEK